MPLWIGMGQNLTGGNGGKDGDTCGQLEALL